MAAALGALVGADMVTAAKNWSCNKQLKRVIEIL
jgi:hypothetical protein